MCMNCGCNERHDNAANITLDDLRKAAEANGQDVDQTIGNIERTYHESPEARDVAQGHAHTF